MVDVSWCSLMILARFAFLNSLTFAIIGSSIFLLMIEMSGFLYDDAIFWLEVQLPSIIMRVSKGTPGALLKTWRPWSAFTTTYFLRYLICLIDLSTYFFCWPNRGCCRADAIADEKWITTIHEFLLEWKIKLLQRALSRLFKGNRLLDLELCELFLKVKFLF